MGVCNCSIFCCMLLCVRSSIAIILMGKRELVALLNLSSWCLVMVERLFLAVPQGCLRFVFVVFPDHTHLLFLCSKYFRKPAQYADLSAVIFCHSLFRCYDPWWKSTNCRRNGENNNNEMGNKVLQTM